jgi:hypothetical protein
MSERAGAHAALVCFSGRSDVPLARLLRPGFRHCFCLLRGPAGWLLIDPRCDRLEVRLLPDAPAARLIGHFARAGCRTVPLAGAAPATTPRGLARFAAGLPGPYSCVGVVKRTLGLRAPGVLTPYALYRHVEKISRSRKNLLTLCSYSGTPVFERARGASAARRAPVAARS